MERENKNQFVSKFYEARNMSILNFDKVLTKHLKGI